LARSLAQRTAIRRSLVAAILLGALTAGVVPAQAQSSAERRGGRLLAGVIQESKRCGELSTRDLAAIGEFAMNRMASSARAHETMNRYMRTRLGPRGEVKIHVALGRRIAGCSGRSPAGFGQIVGLTGMMGLRRAPGQSPGWRKYGAYGGPGAMMGWRGERGDDDEGPSAGAMVGIMAVLIAAVALAVFLLRPRKRRSDPVETLRRRFAGGEISAEEYRERLQLLEGGPPS
jgi:uncharacterized membrane protein